MRVRDGLGEYLSEDATVLRCDIDRGIIIVSDLINGVRINYGVSASSVELIEAETKPSLSDVVVALGAIFGSSEKEQTKEGEK